MSTQPESSNSNLYNCCHICGYNYCVHARLSVHFRLKDSHPPDGHLVVVSWWWRERANTYGPSLNLLWWPTALPCFTLLPFNLYWFNCTGKFLSVKSHYLSPPPLRWPPLLSGLSLGGLMWSHVVTHIPLLKHSQSQSNLLSAGGPPASFTFRKIITTRATVERVLSHLNYGS